MTVIPEHRRAMFVGCATIHADRGRAIEVHAGVEMELISGGATVGTCRTIVRSTLTGETFRVHPMLVEPLRGKTEDEIADLALVCARGCECGV